MNDDDGDELVVYISEDTVPEQWVAEVESEREAALLDDPGPDPDTSHQDSYDLPIGSENWTDRQWDEWAVELGIPRAETRWRYGIVDGRSDKNRVADRAIVPPRSGWDDVPLDGILDAVAAGTFTLPTPTVGMLADGSLGLFYPGRVNGIAGESGAGKGWIALTVAAERMGLGFHVYYLDFEDSPALAVLRLVKVLGVEPSVVSQFFHYKHPANHDAEGIARMVEQVAATSEAFVVIDSTGESIAAAGLNQNHDEEVARWFQDLAHPLADKADATVLLLDHMVKSEDGGLWPIGSQRKRAAITGAQYVVEIAQPFSKGADGMVVLKVAKDRHGAREARSVATYIQMTHPIESMTTLADGTVEIVLSEALTVTLGVGKSAGQVKADKDARVSRALNADVAQLDALTPPPTSQRDVMARMSWGASKAMKALQEWRSRQPGSTS